MKPFSLLCNNLICLDKSCKKSLYIILIIGFILIPILVVNNKNNILNKTLDKLEHNYTLFSYKMTGWLISHFILYLIIGFMCPNQFLLFLIIGILWETLEYIVVILTGEKIWTNNKLSYQYGDIIANTLGYILGAGIKLLLLKFIL
jgi:hypothetical protein